MSQEKKISNKSPFVSIHVFLLICIAAILIWQVNQLIAALEHTNKIIAKTNLVERQIVDLQIGLRGFVITGDPVFVEPYDKALQELPATMESFRKLVKDNPQQIKRFDQVVVLLKEWEKFSKNVINLKKLKKDPTILIQGLHGKTLIDSIRIKIREILSAEGQLEAERLSLTYWQSKRFFWILLTTLVLIGLLLLRSLILRRRWEAALEENKAQLEASEANYREADFNLGLALDSAKMGTWWMDIKSMRMHISPTLADLYGIAESEMTNSDFIAKHIHPDDRDELRLKLKETFSNLKPSYQEFRIIHTDGEVRWHYSKSKFSFDKEGKLIRLYGVQGDRTEGKLIGDKLRESEEKYRNLVIDAQDGIVIVSDDGQIIFANNQLEKMFGYSSKELLNQPIEILVPETLRRIHFQQRTEYLANPAKRPMGRIGFEINGCHKNGNEFPVEIGLSPSETQKGKIITAIVRDMSARNKREKQTQFLALVSLVLAESLDNADTLKKMAELVVNQIADGCVVRLLEEDAKFHLEVIVHRDSKMQLFLERLANSLYTRGILPIEVREALQTKTVRIRNDFNETRIADLKLNSEERQNLEQLGEFNSVVIPLRIKGEVIGTLSLLSNKIKQQLEESDIGFLESIGTQLAFSIENVHLYNKAQRAIKLREEILAIVSHDLRNPLSTIQMASQLLPSIVGDENKIKTFSKKILRSTDQMKRMIEDLMDFAKIQEGNLSIEKKVEEPNKVIDLVFEMMKGQADEKGLELLMKVSPEFPIIQFDYQRIAQALLNLVGNAIKFTEVGGCIHLSALELKGGVKFSVTDTGPGISEQDLPKIFDRYWQAKRSKTLSAGLGLSIAKGIVEAHDGKIWVESKIGHGSSFYFVLPIST